MRPTERDNQMLLDIRRVPHSADHLAELYFDGNGPETVERLKHLEAEHYLCTYPGPHEGHGERARPYEITRFGLDYLIYDAELLPYGAPMPKGRFEWSKTHSHRMEINSARVALTLEAATLSDHRVRFIYWEEFEPLLHGNGSYGQRLHPDAALTIERNGKKRILFIEVDQCERIISETGYSVESKLWRYSEAFDARIHRSVFMDYWYDGFTVLFLATSSARIESIKRVAREVGAPYVWLAERNELKRRKLLTRPIWQNHERSNLMLLSASERATP